MELTYSKLGNVLGTVTLPDAPFPTTNLVYFCQTCGKSWGQILRKGSRTFRMVYRECGCNPHDALSAFEPSLFQPSPYQPDLKGYRAWQIPSPAWPAPLLRSELLTLCENLLTRTYYDSAERNI